jgi:hypothetical protein
MEQEQEQLVELEQEQLVELVELEQPVEQQAQVLLDSNES